MEYNPYYKEDKYSYKRDTYIFDYITLDGNNEQFIEAFKKLEFEAIFKCNINEFLNKMISKIKNISNFGIIMELVDIKKISKIDDFIDRLKDKFEQIVERQIELLTGEQLNEAIKIISKFVNILYIHEKNYNFLQQKISRLDKKISSLIYNELLIRYKGDNYKDMKEYIYQTFLNKLDNIDNIIDFIDSLDKNSENKFLEELIKKVKFTKEEFY